MNSQLKSFSWSLAIHALIFAAIVILSRSMPARKPLVIDFSIVTNQESKAEAFRDTPSQSEQSPVTKRKSVVKDRKSEVKSQKVEIKEIKQQQASSSLNDTPMTEMSDSRLSPLSGKPQDALDEEASHDTVNAKSNGSSESSKEGTVTASGNAASAIAENSKAGYVREHFTYIRDAIMKNLSYPHMAKKMGWTGKVTISFVINEKGGAEDIKIIESSGFAILDKHAVEAVKKALPLPKPPLRAEIIIPVVYRLD
jgi:protein TonB